jgi:hypothetical protein
MVMIFLLGKGLLQIKTLTVSPTHPLTYINVRRDKRTSRKNYAMIMFWKESRQSHDAAMARTMDTLAQAPAPFAAT